MIVLDTAPASYRPFGGNVSLALHMWIQWIILVLTVTNNKACHFFSLGNRGSISPKAQIEQEKRIRREIANSNERRRMQSINAGFQSLRALLPQRDGEKMSKVREIIDIPIRTWGNSNI